MVKYNPQQITVKEFKTTFGRSLNPENRWIRLVKLIPWDEFHEIYAKTLCKDFGRPAKDSRLIIGSLIVKGKKKLTDEELVEEIQENAYIQFFLGYESFTHKKPFHATLLVTIRKRLGKVQFNEIMESLMNRIKELETKNPPPQNPKRNRKKPKGPTDSEQSELSLDSSEENKPTHKGQLLLDAVVAPSDIKFPTDIDLLNNAREKAEHIIDILWSPAKGKTKPRTYRNRARKDYLTLVKKKKKSGKEIRKAIRKQLGYLGRDIRYILDMLDPELGKPIGLSAKELRIFWIIQEIYRQQEEMYQEKKNRVADRIVSISQPYVRPIVRGKAAHPTEFGAKISASLVDGYAFVDHISWDAFNESKDLISQVERYDERFGHYPEAVIADGIYGTRENRNYLKERGIRLSCKPLGRPKKMSDKERKAAWQQKRLDTRLRNQIEGKFGEGKRKYGMDCIKSKTLLTSESAICLIFLVMNLARLERVLFALIQKWLLSMLSVFKERQVLSFVG